MRCQFEMTEFVNALDNLIECKKLLGVIQYEIMLGNVKVEPDVEYQINQALLEQ